MELSRWDSLTTGVLKSRAPFLAVMGGWVEGRGSGVCVWQRWGESGGERERERVRVRAGTSEGEVEKGSEKFNVVDFEGGEKGHSQEIQVPSRSCKK